jgi:threonine dehydrogenase-like Zn-dependent dehydrogenase
VRVPFANIGAFKLPKDLPDEKLLFLGDVYPTGYMAAENAEIEAGDTVAIWGAGPVGLFAAVSAKLMGAGQIIVIDQVPERLQLAAETVGAKTIDFKHEDDVLGVLNTLTDGRGPDRCIDAVGLEAHGQGIVGAYDRAKQAVKLETDRPAALREIIVACRKGGTVSVPGVYGGFIDKYPMGAFMNKALTMKAGQTHVHRYVPKLLELVQAGKVDPAFVITHRLPLDEAPAGYEMFRDKEDECIKVVLRPWD